MAIRLDIVNAIFIFKILSDKLENVLDKYQTGYPTKNGQ